MKNGIHDMKKILPEQIKYLIDYSKIYMYYEKRDPEPDVSTLTEYFRLVNFCPFEECFDIYPDEEFFSGISIPA